MLRKVYSDIDSLCADMKALDAFMPIAGDASILSKPLDIGGREIANRLCCQAMEGCDGLLSGEPGELTVRRYDRLTDGGAALIWYEATAVMREGRANPRQLWINENNLDAFKRHTDRIKERALKSGRREPVLIMQATHSGRYSKPDGAPAPLIAYNNPLFEGAAPISKDRIVTDEYLDRVGEALVKGAMLAERAGFDGVDIKCCHRYLNSELLSAYEREGRYGGSLENRTRLLRESVKGAKQSCGADFTVTSRLNVYDGFEYPLGFGVKKGEGITPDLTEAKWLVSELYSLGVRLLDITMGNPYFNPHVNRPFAKGGYEAEEHPLVGVKRMLDGTAEIKGACPDMKIICSALSYLGASAPFVAAGYISEGAFDVAGFGRMILAYPDFARDIIEKGGLDSSRCCICCSKCTEIMRAGGTPGCVIRDAEVYAPLYKEYVVKK